MCQTTLSLSEYLQKLSVGFASAEIKLILNRQGPLAGFVKENTRKKEIRCGGYDPHAITKFKVCLKILRNKAS